MDLPADASTSAYTYAGTGLVTSPACFASPTPTLVTLGPLIGDSENRLHRRVIEFEGKKSNVIALGGSVLFYY
jgi:hypothetical protein